MDDKIKITLPDNFEMFGCQREAAGWVITSLKRWCKFQNVFFFYLCDAYGNEAKNGDHFKVGENKNGDGITQWFFIEELINDMPDVSFSCSSL